MEAVTLEDDQQRNKAAAEVEKREERYWSSRLRPCGVCMVRMRWVRLLRARRRWWCVRERCGSVSSWTWSRERA